MRKEIIDILTFDELSSDIKQKVLDANRDINVDCMDWWDYTLEEFIANDVPEWLDVDASDITWEDQFNIKIEGSIDLTKWISDQFGRKAFIMNPYTIIMDAAYAGDISADTFDNYISGDWDYDDDVSTDDGEWYERLAEQWISDAQSEVQTMAQNLGRALRDLYDDLQSDEQVEETMEANEWEFTENGERY